MTKPVPPAPDADLLTLLSALEVELHHPGRPCDEARLQVLLHPDFHEVGRSGRPYDRATVLRFLSSRRDIPPVESFGFGVSRLAPDTALLCFRSHQRRASDGAVELPTWRSSLWLRTAVGWQLRYHQGTPADDTPIPGST